MSVTIKTEVSNSHGQTENKLLKYRPKENVLGRVGGTLLAGGTTIGGTSFTVGTTVSGTRAFRSGWWSVPTPPS